MNLSKTARSSSSILSEGDSIKLRMKLAPEEVAVKAASKSSQCLKSARNLVLVTLSGHLLEKWPSFPHFQQLLFFLGGFPVGRFLVERSVVGNEEVDI